MTGCRLADRADVQRATALRIPSPPHLNGGRPPLRTVRGRRTENIMTHRGMDVCWERGEAETRARVQTILCRVRFSFSWDAVLHCRFACLSAVEGGAWPFQINFFFHRKFPSFPNWQYVLNAPSFASRRRQAGVTLGPLFDPSLPLPIARPFAFVRSSIFT